MSVSRQCGECQLCCKLTPVQELDKPANTRCKHQRFGKGCGIYPRRPQGCRLWSCRWLVNDDADDLKRPDRVHYVIDPMPDFVKTVHNETGEERKHPCIQIWLDPNYPDAHQDPALRAWLERKAAKGYVIALIRNGNDDAFVLVPPAFTEDAEWLEHRSAVKGEEHTAEEIFKALSR